MKILVVGGTGLIGGHAAIYLGSCGHDVAIMARHPPPRASIIATLAFIQGDYMDGKMTENQLSSFDAVVFAAGSDIRFVPGGASPDEHYLSANGIAVPRFARLVRDAGVKIFIHIGSFYFHVAPELVESNAYVRSRKLAAERVIALAGPHFYPCSLDAPYIVGTIPGIDVPMFVAYTRYAEGKLSIAPFAPAGGTNFMSVRSLSEAISGALKHASAISGRSILLGDENLTFSAYFEMFFRAVKREVTIEAATQVEHPLMPSETLYTGRKIITYEPNEEDVILLGNYHRHDIQNAVDEIVAQYKST